MGTIEDDRKKRALAARRESAIGELIAKSDVSAMSDAEVAEFFGQITAAAHDLVEEAVAVPWLLQNHFASGCIYLLAGEPKRGRKSIIQLDLAICVATGTPWLGKIPIVGGPQHALLANIEDGRARLARRLKQMGVRAEQSIPLRVVWRRDVVPILLEIYSRVPRVPALLSIDPFIELGIDQADFNENDSRAVTELLRPYRDFAQRFGSMICLTHHFRKEGDRMRGSSALEGAVDGWINSYYRGEGKPNLLQWETRDSSPHEADVMVGIDNTTNVGSVMLVDEIREGHSLPPKARRKSGERDSVDTAKAPKEEKKATLSAAEVEHQVLATLRRKLIEAEFEERHEPYVYAAMSANKLTEAIGVGHRRVTAALKTLYSDGTIRKVGGQWGLSVPK